ncbi:organic cation transporter-like protein [Lingula anatina]|uniref:Organic cation transporter-like protein n=1 Tax=Lingula anatina TaxID=7574 RepID=A0A1S3H7W5_LINAN|nr:organic cation transporter-like protein [Lingula anatina]|eukprot:XP_013381219.1 organic cation transporter-like protein [Lingula anatina]
MHLDELLHIIGEFGTFQKRQYFLVCLVGLYTALPILCSVFLAATPKHNCKIPAEYVSSAERVYGNLSHEELLNLTIPWEEKDGELTRSSCKLKSWDRNASIVDIGNNTASVECPQGLDYSQEIYTSTVISEFDLSCGNEWLVSTSQSVFFVGKLVGDALSGIISDRFGRRPTFLVAIILSASVGILTALSPNMIVYIVSQGLQGSLSGCIFLTTFTLGVEFVGPSKRNFAGFGVMYFFSIGYFYIVLFAYFIRNWRHLALVLYVPAYLFGLYYL